MSFQVCKFGSLINLQSLNHDWSVLLDQIALQLDRERVLKEREDGERGGGAIIRGRRLMEGRLLFEEIQYLFYCLLFHNSDEVTGLLFP